MKQGRLTIFFPLARTAKFLVLYKPWRYFVLRRVLITASQTFAIYSMFKAFTFFKKFIRALFNQISLVETRVHLLLRRRASGQTLIAFNGGLVGVGVLFLCSTSN